MADSERLQPVQGVFECMGDEREGLVCDCFHGRIDGLGDSGRPLMCIDAPWWCPKVCDSRSQGNPRASNTGVRFENLDHAKQG